MVACKLINLDHKCSKTASNAEVPLSPQPSTLAGPLPPGFQFAVWFAKPLISPIRSLGWSHLVRRCGGEAFMENFADLGLENQSLHEGAWMPIRSSPGFTHRG